MLPPLPSDRLFYGLTNLRKRQRTPSMEFEFRVDHSSWLSIVDSASSDSSSTSVPWGDFSADESSLWDDYGDGTQPFVSEFNVGDFSSCVHRPSYTPLGEISSNDFTSIAPFSSSDASTDGNALIGDYATLFPGNNTQESSDGAFVLLNSQSKFHYLPSVPSPEAGSDSGSDSPQSSNDNILPSRNQGHTYGVEAARLLSGPSHEATESHADLHHHSHTAPTTEHDADEEDEEKNVAHVDGEVASISCCILLGEMVGNVRVFRTECNAELQRDKKMLKRHFTEHKARGELEWNLYRCPFTRLKSGICKPKESSPLDAVVGVEVLVNHVFSLQHFDAGRSVCKYCGRTFSRLDQVRRHLINDPCPELQDGWTPEPNIDELTEQATEEVVEQVTEEVVEQTIEQVTELITDDGRRPAKRRRRG